MDLITIHGGRFHLGWRFTLPEEVRLDPETASLVDECIGKCSSERIVALPTFRIARRPIQISDVIGDPYGLEGVSTLHALCEFVDSRLALDGLRLPTEDELEAAAGGTLFPWGMTIPDGIPYGDETSFTEHNEPSVFGLQLLGDPYKVELCRTALKFGDGGVTICGGAPWPLAWLPLAPSFRLIDADITDCFPETLEECYVRPVQIPNRGSG